MLSKVTHFCNHSRHALFKNFPYSIYGHLSRASKRISLRNSMFTSYLSVEGHEDGETGQVSTTAYTVSLVCLYQETALHGPVAALLCTFPVDAEDLFDTGLYLKIEQVHHVLPWEGRLSECQSMLVGCKEVTPWVRRDQVIFILSEDDHHQEPVRIVPTLLGFRITENKPTSLGSQNFTRCHWFQDFILQHGSQIKIEYKAHLNFPPKYSLSQISLISSHQFCPDRLPHNNCSYNDRGSVGKKHHQERVKLVFNLFFFCPKDVRSITWSGQGCELDALLFGGCISFDNPPDHPQIPCSTSVAPCHTWKIPFLDFMHQMEKTYLSSPSPT